MSQSDQQAADRREQQIRVLEAAVTAGVVGILTRRLESIASGLTRAPVDVSRAIWARQIAAGQLSTLRVDLAGQVLRFLPRAAELGAQHVDAPLPEWFDPSADSTIVQALERADATVQARVQAVAVEVLASPLASTTQAEALAGRVTAAARAADTAVGDVVARTVATGAVTAARAANLDVTWWTEPGACLSCTSMAGSTPGDDGLFRPVRTFAPRIIPWLPAGIASCPAHSGCRCHVAAATPGLADALRREAEREVAKGESAYDSLPSRLKAVDRLLAARTSRIPKSVRERAAHDRARGAFSRPQPRSAA